MDGSALLPMPGREEFRAKLVHKVSPRELKLIMLAYKFSKYGHRGQVRDGGGRYFDHPKAVALILIDELGYYDSEMIIAALLHDVVEDTYLFDFEDIETIFGSRVENIVCLLTKDKDPAFKEAKRQYLSAIAQAEDAAVRIIKLADRLHNLRTLECCDEEKRARIVEETVEFYLPIAECANVYLACKIRALCERLVQKPEAE